MTPEEVKKLIRREAEETWESGKTHVIHETSHAHRVHHLPGGEKAHGTASIKETRDAVRAAFSDHRIRIEHLIVEGDMAAARLILTGKHTGEIMGVPPTGKEIHLIANNIYRIEDGKIAELWTEWDRLALLEQLGLAPAKALGK